MWVHALWGCANKMIETIEKVKFLSGFSRSISFTSEHSHSSTACRTLALIWFHRFAGDHIYSVSSKCIAIWLKLKSKSFSSISLWTMWSVRERQSTWFYRFRHFYNIDRWMPHSLPYNFRDASLKRNNQKTILLFQLTVATCLAAGSRVTKCVHVGLEMVNRICADIRESMPTNNATSCCLNSQRFSNGKCVVSATLLCVRTHSERRQGESISKIDRNKCTGSRSQLLTHVYANAFRCR